MNEQTSGIRKELQETNEILNGISVPIGLLQQIGLPIMAAMDKLHKCIEAIPETAAEAAQEKEPDPNEEKAIREEDL